MAQQRAALAARPKDAPFELEAAAEPSTQSRIISAPARQRDVSTGQGAREVQMSPEAQLKHLIAKFTPEIAALAEATLAEMRGRFPNANQLVYDNYNALVIGFGPSERASDTIFSIALYPKSVNLCFLQAGKVRLHDPRKLLQGGGTTNRFIPLRSATALDAPEMQDLMAQALTGARVPMSQSASGRLIMKSVSAKQRPRRPMRE